MRRILLFLFTMLISLSTFGQAKKPIIMVVPSDIWCNQEGYTKTFNNQGESRTVPDYGKAFINNGELKTAITAISSLMQDQGFPLKDMEQTIKSINLDNAENMVMTSKEGQDIDETPLDVIKKRAKCDIILDLYWKINKMGPRYSLTYNLRALDAYTNKQVAGVTGTGQPTIVLELAPMIQEAVVGSMDPFTNQLMTHFNDMAENGREVTLDIKKWQDTDVDLENEVDGKALMDFIEDWVADHTVKGSYSLIDATETFMRFEQVRIPLFNEQGRALDTRRWARDLSSTLSSKGISNKLMMRGLGEASIVIGGK